mmetsp:Transcript_89376/g.213525  ORF Transcript_89376/g.213525 Transcript_89376/m.213525 type:complete len:233 (+) Transcript_89376:569-1267(+)
MAVVRLSPCLSHTTVSPGGSKLSKKRRMRDTPEESKVEPSASESLAGLKLVATSALAPIISSSSVLHRSKGACLCDSGSGGLASSGAGAKGLATSSRDAPLSESCLTGSFVFFSFLPFFSFFSFRVLCSLSESVSSKSLAISFFCFFSFFSFLSFLLFFSFLSLFLSDSSSKLSLLGLIRYGASWTSERTPWALPGRRTGAAPDCGEELQSEPALDGLKPTKPRPAKDPSDS